MEKRHYSLLPRTSTLPLRSVEIAAAKVVTFLRTAAPLSTNKSSSSRGRLTILISLMTHISAGGRQPLQRRSRTTFSSFLDSRAAVSAEKKCKWVRILLTNTRDDDQSEHFGALKLSRCLVGADEKVHTSKRPRRHRWQR